MLKAKLSKEGVVLFMVLCVLLVVASLTTVILNLISSHARLTYHQTGRIQAYYAALAGVNYGFDKLRTGSWVAGTDCTAGSPCTITFSDGDFYPSVLINPTNGVTITIRTAGSSGCSSPPAPTGGACISATADYAHSS